MNNTPFTVFLRVRWPFYESIDTQGREIIRNFSLWNHKHSLSNRKTVYRRDYGKIGLKKINFV